MTSLVMDSWPSYQTRHETHLFFLGEGSFDLQLESCWYSKDKCHPFTTRYFAMVSRLYSYVRILIDFSPLTVVWCLEMLWEPVPREEASRSIWAWDLLSSVSKVYGVFSNKLFPSSSGRQLGAITIACVVLGVFWIPLTTWKEVSCACPCKFCSIIYGQWWY